MKSFRYIAVEWRHEHSHEPILLLSEVDDAGWEQRKVEVFRDGSKGYADANAHSLKTRLGEAPIPTVAEIVHDNTAARAADRSRETLKCLAPRQSVRLFYVEAASYYSSSFLIAARTCRRSSAKNASNRSSTCGTKLAENVS